MPIRVLVSFGPREIWPELMAMNHSRHSYLMIGLLGVGALLLLSGTVGGGALVLLWPLACMAMMFFMMRGVGGMGRNSEHTHEHGVTHAHGDAPTHSHG